MSKTEASIENIYKLDGRVPVVKALAVSSRVYLDCSQSTGRS